MAVYVAGEEDRHLIKLGLIGCGLIVNNQHVKAFRELMEKAPDLFEIVATCDIREENARSVAEKIASFQKGRAPNVYTDYKRMLEAEYLDAVSVATPHFAHHQPAIDALNAGINVLVEKPFAITVKAGRKMNEAADKNKRVLACVEPHRRSPINRMIDWAINKARLIGDPRFFLYHRIFYNLGVVVGTPWRHQKVQSGGGWVFDGEVHYVDFLRMVFGDVAKVYAQVKNFESTRYLDQKNLANPVPSDVEDTAFAVLTFKSGLIGSFIWTVAAVGEQVMNRCYYGSQGSLNHPDARRDANMRTKSGETMSFDELEKRFMESLSQKEKERLFPLGMMNNYSISFYDFFDSIVNKRPPEITGEDALAAQAICDAILESATVGEAVSVKDVVEGRIDAYQREINEYWKI
ncbi:MAG: Gfo/Idh/MocA family oxidoreductase [Nitrososphaerota archaeon]